MMAIQFSAPVRLISEANQREHWAKRRSRKVAQQTQMLVAWREHVKGAVGFPCRILLTRIGPKALDKDNLAGSFKHVQDQIARMLKIDDGDSRIDWQYAQRAIGRREYALEVTIESGVR